MDKLGDWLDNCSYVLEDIGDWFLDAWPVILTICLAILFIGFVGYCIAYASGAFFDEVENYDFSRASIKAVTMAETMMHGFGNAINELPEAKRKHTYEAIAQSISDLANGIRRILVYGYQLAGFYKR